MRIEDFLDSTYLKTPAQAHISKEETAIIITQTVNEAIEFHFKLVMIRPEYVKQAHALIKNSNSSVLVGTVIDFPEGKASVKDKLEQAQQAIDDKADELDFVINYQAFLAGKVTMVKSEVFSCTKLCLENSKTLKWIIETAALTTADIIGITQLVRDVVLENFGEKKAKNVFVKSSTGFYKTANDKPNGATLEAMQLIVQHASPLKTKASGGIKTLEDAKKMIKLGVTRIGTSSAKIITEQKNKKN